MVKNTRDNQGIDRLFEQGGHHFRRNSYTIFLYSVHNSTFYRCINLAIVNKGQIYSTYYLQVKILVGCWILMVVSLVASAVLHLVVFVHYFRRFDKKNATLQLKFFEIVWIREMIFKLIKQKRCKIIKKIYRRTKFLCTRNSCCYYG